MSIFRRAGQRRKSLFLFFTLLGVCHAVTTSGAERNEAIFREAAATVGVPVALTQAIAGVESGGSPWALNVAGRGHIYASRDEALAAAWRAEAAGQSFDSGIMQINNWWLRRYGIPLEAVFEPEANILLGAWILKQAIEQDGDVWKGVGRYHSPDANRGRHYAALVRRALERGPAQQSAAAPGRRSRGLAHAKREKTRTTTPAGQDSATRGVVLAESERPPFVQRRPLQTVSAGEAAPPLLHRVPAQPSLRNDPVYAEPERPVQARSSMVVYRANQGPVFQRIPAETSANADGAFERSYQ